jgi:predicted nuclease of predicted toxin-antitoxin system
VRFLVDEQLSPALCAWLTARAHRAEHVADALGPGAPDLAVADHAAAAGAILITKERDFADRAGCPVLRVPLGNATTARLLPWLDARWATAEPLLRAGERLVELR